ncbi:MAG TPA: TlpA disulfide reductase family protein [Spirochaetota bacterium]|nr:TlpA disulfide reductase family protein [Spirochaetota bacterium]HOS33165.1 TlpA disulfide reductase family protein [Spirochaetota bacterium]HOS55327.1 TlpA disulfide reductase family protein [Spirochaetota bacterium]HPK62080.1 TlpA disulfide reductase family protein [Spirochaetota bacterium]HQF76890.1 TlpA disulfide reductase family protein [Spirochaetota bacterium]
MKKNLIVSLILVSVFLSLLGCKNKTPTGVVYDPTDLTDSDIEEYISNKEFDLLILNYWATYCSPCKEEMRDFVKLFDKYKNDGLLIVGASLDSPSELNLIKKICGFLKINYPIVYGIKSNFRNIEIGSLPKTFIIDKNNNILQEIDGKRDYNFFKEIIDKNLTPGSTISNEVPENIKTIEKKYYSVEYYSIKNGEKYDLFFSLKPKSGFYLNGEGYPTLDIEFKLSDGCKLSPNSIKLNGAKQNDGNKNRVEIEFANPNIKKFLSSTITAIACSDSQCIKTVETADFILE